MLIIVVIIPRNKKQKFRSFSYLTVAGTTTGAAQQSMSVLMKRRGQLARDWESMCSR